MYVGEFDYESDVWNVFNLMVFVYEGEEVIINVRLCYLVLVIFFICGIFGCGCCVNELFG